MPLIPVGDDNHHRDKHWLNWTFIIIGLAVLGFAVVKDRNFTMAALDAFMLKPGDTVGFANKGDLQALGASIFIHQNPFLLGLYVYMLWMLGDNVEYIMGHLRYLVFFILTAAGALFAQLHWGQSGDALPVIGFGGAAFAVMGAYLACFPNIKVDMIYWFQETTMSVKWLPAIYLLIDAGLGLWWSLDRMPGFFDILSVEYLRISAIHFGAFWVGYILYFIFRDRSVIIDLPLHKRSLERTGEGHEWDHL